jgi:hypothetical protein
MDLPQDIDDTYNIITNHTSPTLKRINETVAISF